MVGRAHPSRLVIPVGGEGKTLVNRPRFTIRTLLILVAIPAILFGISSELTETRERNFFASQQQILLDQSGEMDRIATDCRARVVSGPFDPTEPAWVELDRRWNLAKEGVPDWGVAAGWFTKAATGTRATAEKLAFFKRHHQARLLLPH
jgi:hypothetical protein